jgi:hypothetical protein
MRVRHFCVELYNVYMNTTHGYDVAFSKKEGELE